MSNYASQPFVRVNIAQVYNQWGVATCPRTASFLMRQCRYWAASGENDLCALPSCLQSLLGNCWGLDVSVLWHAVVAASALCKDSWVSLQHQVPLYAVQPTCPDKSLCRCFHLVCFYILNMACTFFVFDLCLLQSYLNETALFKKQWTHIQICFLNDAASCSTINTKLSSLISILLALLWSPICCMGWTVTHTLKD